MVLVLVLVLILLESVTEWEGDRGIPEEFCRETTSASLFSLSCCSTPLVAAVAADGDDS